MFKAGMSVLVKDSHGLLFKCKILDIKNSYGNIRYKVAPVYGSGEAWIENVYQIIK